MTTPTDREEVLLAPGSVSRPGEIDWLNRLLDRAGLRCRLGQPDGTEGSDLVELPLIAWVPVPAGTAHLAAHGRHQAENALFSTLELAGGPLLGYDLQRLGRSPAMVVLSACDLGLADVRPGDETVGMVTALLATGTGTVVASVARVGDDPAAEIMTGFHRLLAAGVAPAAALARAGQAGPPAGFVCFGAG